MNFKDFLAYNEPPGGYEFVSWGEVLDGKIWINKGEQVYGPFTIVRPGLVISNSGKLINHRSTKVLVKKFKLGLHDPENKPFRSKMDRDKSVNLRAISPDYYNHSGEEGV